MLTLVLARRSKTCAWQMLKNTARELPRLTGREDAKPTGPISTSALRTTSERRVSQANAGLSAEIKWTEFKGTVHRATGINATISPSRAHANSQSDYRRALRRSERKKTRILSDQGRGPWPRRGSSSRPQYVQPAAKTRYTLTATRAEAGSRRSHLFQSLTWKFMAR